MKSRKHLRANLKETKMLVQIFTAYIVSTEQDGSPSVRVTEGTLTELGEVLATLDGYDPADAAAVTTVTMNFLRLEKR